MNINKIIKMQDSPNQKILHTRNKLRQPINKKTVEPIRILSPREVRDKERSPLYVPRNKVNFVKQF